VRPSLDPVGHAEIQSWWVAQLADALEWGRGLVVEGVFRGFDPSWWPGTLAHVLRDNERNGDELLPAVELLVIDGLTRSWLDSPGEATRLLRAATAAAARRCPVLVSTPSTLASLNKASITAAPPWELDTNALLAAEELSYLLDMSCGVSGAAEPAVTGVGALYLTPIERRIASLLAEHNIEPYRADFLVEGRLVVECDGAAWHTPEVDARRDEHLRSLGYPTVRLTGRAIFGDKLGCLARIRRGLDAAPRPLPISVLPLTAFQLRAVAHRAGPALVVAPAGSGKTRVVADRVRRLIDGGVDPARICCVSFANAAVDEMRDRIGLEGAEVRCTTLHALGREIAGGKPVINKPKPGLPTRWMIIRPLLTPLEARNRGSSRYWTDLITTFRQTLVVPDLTGSPLGGTDQTERALRFMQIHAAYEEQLNNKRLTDFAGQLLDAVRILACDLSVGWRRRRGTTTGLSMNFRTSLRFS
jgi:UvrD/REP helicase N-terminal domain/Protein of unknown function (DUF559)